MEMDYKKDNFKRIAENRTNKIITTIQQLGNLTNNSYYNYSKEDIESMFFSIEENLNTVKKKLLDNINKDNRKFEL